MANNPQFPGTQPPPPPNVGSMDPPRSFVPSMSFQFRPVVPAQPPPQYIPVASQIFQPAQRGVPGMNPGLPSQPQTSQFSPMMPQLPARSGQPGHIPPLPHTMAVPNSQSIRPMHAGASLPQPNVQTPNNYMSGFGGPGTPLTSYSFGPPPSGLPMSINTATHYQPITQVSTPSVPAGVQPGLSVSQSMVSVTPQQPTCEQPSVSTINVPPANLQPKASGEVPTDWIEHTSAEGRRYYFNKRARQSSWEKPFELMTPIERADATTDWKEFTSPDGRKYYYNKVTKQSKWSIPEELKIAREQVEKESIGGPQSEAMRSASAPVFTSVVKAPPADATSDTIQETASSPISVAPVVAASSVQPAMVSGLAAPVAIPSSPARVSSALANAGGVDVATGDDTQEVSAGSANAGNNVTLANTSIASKDNCGNFSAKDVSSADGFSVQDAEVPEGFQETEKGVISSEKVKSTMEEKAIEQEPVTFASKLEAKDAFKALLESANVGSDWTWEQAMRIIINDKRYGALRTLGERKQAFNEFLSQKKKLEAEERRVKQKKAREEYKKMLEESTELTSSTRWSKVATMFEEDERFKAVERERDRRDLFENFIDELKEKERVKAQEERKQNIMEYRKYLESCDFIKANSQWRKVQDRVEADERCLRLEKMDRLEIFQEYLHDLEREEEEQRKLEKEELRKAERKNRDEFRKLMEGHVIAGTLTAKTHWRDYCMKVKELPAYMAVASNTSGATPKDLFEDVAEELEKQYHEDKSRIKDAIKLRKVTLSATWTLEDLKIYILEDISSPPISDVNLRLVFDDLLARAKEKEEKEAKKRKRLADDMLSLLRSFKEITASSTWEDCKHLVEGSQECSSTGEESFLREIFDEHIMQLKEQAKENERKRKEEKVKKEKEREEREKRKTKHGREKERGREREKDYVKDDIADTEDVDMTESHVCKENKRLGKDSDKKHRKRHQSARDSSNENEKEHTRSSHRHGSDHKKSRRHASTPESDGESRRRRHRRDHRNGSHKNGDHNELEDGEYGEDREN